MILIKIPFFVIGIIFGILWTLIVFASALTASLIAMIFAMLLVPFTFFAKNANPPNVESLVTGPFSWAMENSSNLWTNLINTLAKL